MFRLVMNNTIYIKILRLPLIDLLPLRVGVAAGVSFCLGDVRFGVILALGFSLTAVAV